MQPYATAGESGREYVTPAGFGVLITGNTFNVRDDGDINRIGDRIVQQIRLKTGVHI